MRTHRCVLCQGREKEEEAEEDSFHFWRRRGSHYYKEGSTGCSQTNDFWVGYISDIVYERLFLCICSSTNHRFTFNWCCSLL